MPGELRRHARRQKAAQDVERSRSDCAIVRRGVLAGALRESPAHFGARRLHAGRVELHQPLVDDGRGHRADRVDDPPRPHVEVTRRGLLAGVERVVFDRLGGEDRHVLEEQGRRGAVGDRLVAIADVVAGHELARARLADLGEMRRGGLRAARVQRLQHCEVLGVEAVDQEHAAAGRDVDLVESFGHGLAFRPTIARSR